MIKIQLPKKIESRLDKLAKLTGRPKSFYVREAILNHLEDIEDLHIAEKRLKTLGETISLESLMATETSATN